MIYKKIMLFPNRDSYLVTYILMEKRIGKY